MLENCIALGVGVVCLFVCCNKLISLQKMYAGKKRFKALRGFGFRFFFFFGFFFCFVLSLFGGFVFS